MYCISAYIIECYYELLMSIRLFRRTLFGVSNERLDKFMFLRIVPGGLELEALLNGDFDPNLTPITHRISHPSLSDEGTAWHTLRILRRAGWLRVFCDDNKVVDYTYEGTNFLLEMSRVHTGCVPDADGIYCQNGTTFQGEIRNFVINRMDVLAALNSAKWSGQKSIQNRIHIINVYQSQQRLLDVLSVVSIIQRNEKPNRRRVAYQSVSTTNII